MKALALLGLYFSTILTFLLNFIKSTALKSPRLLNIEKILKAIKNNKLRDCSLDNFSELHGRVKRTSSSRFFHPVSMNFRNFLGRKLPVRVEKGVRISSRYMLPYPVNSFPKKFKIIMN